MDYSSKLQCSNQKDLDEKRFLSKVCKVRIKYFIF